MAFPIVGLPAKLKLVREMAKARAHRFPDSDHLPSMIDEMPVEQVAGLPEFSIATIVETYAVLMTNGVAPIEALQAIEVHRASTGTAAFSGPPDLEEYVHARIEIERGDRALPLPAGWVDACIDHCRLHYDLGPRASQLLERMSIPTV